VRISRYKEKIEYILEALSEIPPEPEKPIEISGTFYNLLTAIEAAMDIAAMLVKDLGKRVEDDYSNIDTLAEIGVIDNKLAEMLKMCSGLRNWLVHRYNRINTRLVLESVEEVRETLTKYIEKVEHVLDEIESRPD